MRRRRRRGRRGAVTVPRMVEPGRVPRPPGSRTSRLRRRNSRPAEEREDERSAAPVRHPAARLDRGPDPVRGHRRMGGPGGDARLRFGARRGPAALAGAAGLRVDHVRGDHVPRDVRREHEEHAALATGLQPAVPPPGADREGVRIPRRRVARAHRPRRRGRVERPRVRGARGFRARGAGDTSRSRSR